MRHPDESVARSVAKPGDLESEPEKIISIVVTDSEEVPSGLLEKWGGSAWIFASADALMPVEPATE